MSRPRASQNPVGQFVYGIMAFNYEQWRNILKGEAIRAKERAQRAGAGYTAEKLAFGLLPALAAIILGNVLTSYLREWLTNRARFEQRKRDGTLADDMVYLGTSRAFGTPFDPAIQMATGLKYDRDPALQLLGPTIGNFGANAGDAFLKPIFGKNSKHSNSTEHNAVRGAYRLISPWGVAALSALPGGPMAAAGYGLAAGTITAPQAGETAGDIAVGPKKHRHTKHRKSSFF